LSIEISPDEQEIIDQWIFILLGIDHNKELHGRIRISKVLFLLSQTIVEELKEPIFFYPYQFGPYSSRLAQRMNVLIESNQIKVDYLQRDWAYSLSPEAFTKAIDLISSLSDSIKENLISLKRRMQKMSSRKILKEIYTNYPEYAQISSIAEEIVFSVDIDLETTQPIIKEENLLAKSDNTEIELTKEETKVILNLVDS